MAWESFRCMKDRIIQTLLDKTHASISARHHTVVSIAKFLQTLKQIWRQTNVDTWQYQGYEYILLKPQANCQLIGCLLKACCVWSGHSCDHWQDVNALLQTGCSQLSHNFLMFIMLSILYILPSCSFFFFNYLFIIYFTRAAHFEKAQSITKELIWDTFGSRQQED